MTLSSPPLREGVQQDGLFSRSWQNWMNEIFDYLRGIGQIGDVTLTLNAATTTVMAKNCSSGSLVVLFPETSAAATEFGAGSLYVVPGKEQFIITHVNSGTAARTFRYGIFG